MKILNGIPEIEEYTKNCRSLITIGNFDGCHIGHQALIRDLLDWPNPRPETPVIALTFQPHPAEFFGRSGKIYRLQRLADRAASLCLHGASAVAVLKFDERIARYKPDEFIQKIIVDLFQTKAIVVGADFRFGAERLGTVKTLQEFGLLGNYEVKIREAVTMNGEIVSSTRVRESITKEADFLKVATMLGRPWGFFGTVMEGFKRGRQIGFPTANLDLGEIVRPKSGVYAVRVRLPGAAAKYDGVMNVGTRPTFDLVEPSIEVHILEQRDLNLYHEDIWVEPVERIRDEIKFNSVDELKRQIHLDCAVAKGVLNHER
ncbi:MAG: riboflavin biosynthesis protein RibF [Proteobacteria bacterium]|nr:riboflavin biosynthesis protein RibF [Pseudomonadota bacterium]